MNNVLEQNKQRELAINLTENKKQARTKFVVPFIAGILVSALFAGIIIFLPVFHSNMPIYFSFSIPNRSDSSLLPTVVEISSQTGGETIHLGERDPQDCSGASFGGYDGTIQITIANNSQDIQSLSVVIPPVSLFDMINYKMWNIDFTWNSSTQQWQQQSQVTFDYQS